MIPLKLYSFRKDPRSTAIPGAADGSTYQCILNTDFDIMAPRLPIQGIDYPTAFNYCYIAAFARYYHIRRWAYEQGLWTAYCDVDVLGTYASEIKASSQYVLRSASASDGAVSDGMYPAKTDATRLTTTTTSLWDLQHPSYVIGVVGSDGIQYYECTSTQLAAVCNYLFSDTFLDAVDTDQVLGELAKGFIDPSDYIKTCFFNPVPLDIAVGAVPIKLGWWTLTQTDTNGVKIPAGYAAHATGSIAVPKHPQAATRGGYLNSAPFSSYELEIQPFGKFTLDPTKLQGVSSLLIDVRMDAQTGDAILTVKAGSTCLVLASGNPTVPIALTQLRTGIGPVLGGAVGGAVGELAGGGLASSLGKLVGGVAGGIAQAYNGIMTGSILPEPSIIGTNGAWAGLYAAPALYGTFLPVVDEDPVHHGRPLCSNRVLSTLTGYVLCEEPHISINGTRDEALEIESALATGVLLE